MTDDLRQRYETVLIEHQHLDAHGCQCGWNTRPLTGASFAAHVTDELLAVRDEDHGKWGCGDCDGAFKRGVEAGKAERDEELAEAQRHDAECKRVWDQYPLLVARCRDAERRLAELEAGLPEWRCPNCGATTRARMADHGPGECAAEVKLAAVREECDRVTRWAHSELHDGFKLESVLETVQYFRAALDGESQ